MEVVYNNPKCESPIVSIIFIDWGCRESFHAIDYLNDQSIPRDKLEIIWIEYYRRRPLELKRKLYRTVNYGMFPAIDQWIVLDSPENIYYHKHLMYNIGIARSRGKIICVADSDGMFKPSFVESIITTFQQHSNIVLHLDEVRNANQKFYPFCYPTFEEIIGKDCINWKNGKTTGLWDQDDPLHTRNYGACMCALRSDIIAIGGSDEHTDFLGHVCGPYDLTFRLVNAGKTEIWHQDEFLYHVWHPGTDGIDNYIGPHDGKHMSSTALEAIKSGRIFPLIENEGIKLLRINGRQNRNIPTKNLLRSDYQKIWSAEAIKVSNKFYKMENYRSWMDHIETIEERSSNIFDKATTIKLKAKRLLCQLFGS